MKKLGSKHFKIFIVCILLLSIIIPFINVPKNVHAITKASNRSGLGLNITGLSAKKEGKATWPVYWAESPGTGDDVITMDYSEYQRTIGSRDGYGYYYTAHGIIGYSIPPDNVSWGYQKKYGMARSLQGSGKNQRHLYYRPGNTNEGIVYIEYFLVNTIQVRYQDADGNWGNYSIAKREDRAYGNGSLDWSRGQDDTYEGASASASYTSNDDITRWVSVQRRYGYYQLDGNGYVDSTWSPKLYWGNTSTKVTVPSKSGYRFDGYFDQRQGGNKIINANGTPAEGVWKVHGNNTVYAHFTALTTTVNFNGNGGTLVSSTTQTFMVSKGQSFADTGASRTGYYIAGWAESPNASSVQYSTYSPVSDDWILAHPNGITLYAVWKYDINYNINTSDKQTKGTTASAPSGDSPIAGVNYTIKNIVGTQEGYVFTKWSTTVSGTGGVSYTPGNTITANPETVTPITLYAQWRKIQNTIAYKSIEPSGTVDVTVSNRQGIKNINKFAYSPADGDLSIENPRKLGYRFIGWTCSQCGINTPTTYINIPYATLKANWLITEGKTITFTANWQQMPSYNFVDELTNENPILKENETNRGKFMIEEIQSTPGYINTHQKRYVDLSNAKYK